MELMTVTEDPHVARRAFLDYRAAVRRPLADRATAAERELRHVDEELMRAYRQLARGVTLLRLSETIRAGGYEIRQYNPAWPSWKVALPKIAVARADTRTLLTNGVEHNGDVVFSSKRVWSGLSLAKRNSTIVRHVFGDGRPEGATSSHTFSAIVPTVPPPFRPARGLAGYHVLFEAEWSSPPVSADPALLKHIGGDLWAVLATWDLTPLEAAVLGHRR